MLSSLISVFKSHPQASSKPLTPVQPEPVPAAINVTALSNLNFLSITDPQERADHNALIKSLWKKHVATNPPTAAQMCLRNILLGRPVERGFSPIQSEIRLRNGHAPYGALEKVLWEIESSEHPWLAFSSLWICPSAQPSYRHRLGRIFGSNAEGLELAKKFSAHICCARERVRELTKKSS